MAEAATLKKVNYDVETFVQPCPKCPAQIRWREISEVRSSRQGGPRPAKSSERFRACHWCAEKEYRAGEWARRNRVARLEAHRHRKACIAYTQGRVLQ